MGGQTHELKFAEGDYRNPGPWRIPSDHYAVLDFCKRFGVKLEPFIQVNWNAYVHNTEAFEGKPQRFKRIQADFRSQIAELLAKSVDQKKLDRMITDEDVEMLVASLKKHGVLNDDLA